jgi:1-aminocyclopropane-1-carboxylate deaminase
VKSELQYKPIIQSLTSKLFSERNIKVDVLRLDLIHPEVSGNKWFKLKYNLEEAKQRKLNTILTFGGAFSNHIAATAAACKLFGFKSIGIIRGEESASANPTLQKAKENGMELHFVAREDYKRKEGSEFIEKLKSKFGDFYLIPEGGDNELGIKGCTEILNGEMNYDQIFCAVGTGTTCKGISRSLKQGQKLIGVNILKGSEEQEGIINDYHFGGYAKHTQELLEFKSNFEKEFNIPLDYIYTSKLFFAVFDSVIKNRIPGGDSVLIIHSGGLQGNEGYRFFNLKPKR